MNTAVFVNFLRHLLFLLVILQFIGGFIIYQTNSACAMQFIDQELLPWNLMAKSHAVFLALHIAGSFVRLETVGVILSNALGFVGAIYLHQYPIINFAAAMNMLVYLFTQLMTAIAMSTFIQSLDVMIEDRIEDLFVTANKQNVTKLAELKQTRRDASYSFGLENEWSVLASGSEENHTVIDYLQLKNKCCGLSGRSYWRIRIPTSCCDEKYPGEECILSRANLASCHMIYDNFKSCLNVIEFLSFIFAVMTFVTVVVACTLARIKKKYPDEDYDSESSSSDSEEYDY